MAPHEFTLDGSPPQRGKGNIAVLSEADWQNACPGCTIAMLTAIAQNIRGGVPVNPLRDGASFGPVSWSNTVLADHRRTPVSWTTAMTGSTIVWKRGVTTVTETGVPPNYTVDSVQVPCVASTTGPDRWNC